MPANLFHSVLLSAAEAVLNGLLALDPRVPNRLEAMSGKSLHVECTSPPFSFNMLVSDRAILLMQGEAAGANAKVKGSAVALLGLLAEQGNASRRDTGVTISGDTGFLQALQEMMVQMDVDWEYQLSKLIGDIPTQALSDGLAGTRQFARQSAANLRDDIDAWLHQENNLFPDASQLESFYRAVDNLRLRVDRLEARTARLQAKVSP